MFDINNISLLMLFSSIISFVLFIYAYLRRDNLAILNLSLILLSSTIWSFFYGLELSFPNSKAINYILFFQQTGISTIPVFWFLFAARYSGNDKWITPSKSMSFFLIPLISSIMIASNDFHNLFYTSVTLKTDFGYTYRILEHGPFWIAHVIYSHILFLIGTLMMFLMIFKATKNNRRRITFLLLGATVPYIVNIAYILGIMPFGFIDLTPIAFIIMGIILSMGIFLVKLFDITPLALDKLFDNIPDAILVLDTNKKLLNANPKAKAIIQNIINNSEPKKEQVAVDIISNFALTNSNENFIFDDKIYDITCSKIQNHNNQKIGDLISLRDVTDRKNAEIKHQKSEENYRLIAENSSDIIWTMDLYGNYHYVSPSVFNMLGYTAEENMKQIITDNLEPESLKYAVELINYAIENISNKITIEPHTIELQQRHKNGSIVWTEVVISPIYENDNFKYFLGVTRNISNRKKIEEDLIAAKEKAEESDRLKSAFLANMSHEIRTPMNGILGFLELIKTLDLSSDTRDNYFEIIEKSGQRLLDTINDIIEISKIESNQIPTQYSDFDLNEILQDQVSFFDQQAKEKGLNLSILQNSNYISTPIHSEKNILNGIITNLIRNAIKFTNNGSIEIAYKIQDQEICFCIKDTGIGIPKDKTEEIFNRFTQVNIHNTRPYEGSGLGLSIVKGYLQMINGRIWVESELGVGSSFFFNIPHIAASSDYSGSSNNQSLSDLNFDFSSINILLAEDDAISSYLIKEIVRHYNINLTHVNNGLECIKTLQERNDFSLILMDIKMPYMDGIETTLKIRETDKNIKIIALTAYALDGDKEKAIEAGCDDFITKPVDQYKLIETIIKAKNKHL